LVGCVDNRGCGQRKLVGRGIGLCPARCGHERRCEGGRRTRHRWQSRRQCHSRRHSGERGPAWVKRGTSIQAQNAWRFGGGGARAAGFCSDHCGSPPSPPGRRGRKRRPPVMAFSPSARRVLSRAPEAQRPGRVSPLIDPTSAEEALRPRQIPVATGLWRSGSRLSRGERPCRSIPVAAVLERGAGRGWRLRDDASSPETGAYASLDLTQWHGWGDARRRFLLPKGRSSTARSRPRSIRACPA
jgi:hypothetical protein